VSVSPTDATLNDPLTATINPGQRLEDLNFEKREPTSAVVDH
jgi:hypothetical protein